MPSPGFIVNRHAFYTSIRDEWSDEAISSKLAVLPGSHFDISYIQANANAATILGKLMIATDTSVDFRVQLGLERQGWRVQSITAFTDGTPEIVLPHNGL